jgi:uncharacterized membrane protein YbhN (UPF0104 family)
MTAATPSAAGVPPARAGRSRRRLARVLGVAFAVLVLGLVAWASRKVDWSAVGGAVGEYTAGTIALAAGIAIASHLLYSLYDRIGMAWSGHRFPAHRVMQISFASFAFNLNLGPLVGALAFRCRMYSRLGLGTEAIARVVGLSLVTNWLGYATLGGGVFLLGGLEPPGDWAIGAMAIRWLGAALWLAVAGYLLACALAHRRSFSVRGHQVTLPRLRMAAVQVLVSCSHWLATAAVLHVLLQGHVGYAEVLAVFLIAAVAGAIAHIPAGLGVLEAVFLGLLSPPLGHHTVIAALLVYRVVYYLMPLAVAVALYLSMEVRATR